MITKLYIENFRSIEKAEVDLGKITVLTGANNSGKSSVIYALLALRNAVLNSNQSIDNILTFSFVNLGGFDETVFQKRIFTSIKIGFETATENNLVFYQLSLGRISSSFEIQLPHFSESLTNKLKLDIAFPYAANKNQMERIRFEDLKGNNRSVDITWNGISLIENSFENVIEDKERWSKESQRLENMFNAPLKALSNFDIIPIARGFTKPIFNHVPLKDNKVTTEEELATSLSLNPDLEAAVSFYLEKIIDRYFRIYNTPNTSIFYLRTRDKNTGFDANLVNEGLGTNQLVTILAKVLQKDNKFICIDEPEIHLHPSVISKLVGVLVEIAEKEGKQFLISTHSEHFITALLKHTHQKDISHEDVKVYYLKKEGQKTVFEHQAINEKGQIEGGLVHFYETELEDLSSLFKLTD